MAYLLIDGNNWFAQCHYATPSEAAATFQRRLQTVLEQIPHSLAVVCWDEGPTFRHTLSTQYKAHRGDKPEGYYDSLAITRQLVDDESGAESFGCQRFEADDCIASMVRIAHDEGEMAILFSADRDLHQLLVTGIVSQVVGMKRVTPNRLSFDAITAEGLLDKYGVKPMQWIDYRAIVGDTSDGIAGCFGLGKAAAAEVLRRCNTLEGFFQTPFAAKISQRQRTALTNYRSELPLKRQLLTLVSDVPIPAAVLNRIHS
ncbi:5'-3' exonuclease [Aureliella helgolandensis]|uniref:DNA polymerase I, thermostable n=1 Tax=Aureliella helgolandensis TaxID=2527968 RepID=A0A518G438_9BACT|nr:5'-3' exonuclease H3TH domain-containing protein [Aureliella helgolandensis]QDV23358.1 DNA polymerase I, thermostable [Aureliella helgolandensis]